MVMDVNRDPRGEARQKREKLRLVLEDGTEFNGLSFGAAQPVAGEAGVSLITDLQLAHALIEALRRRSIDDLSVLAWQDYMARDRVEIG